MTSARVHRAAVVGASGFLGRNLAMRLAADGMLCGSYTRANPFSHDDGAADPGLLAADTVYWLASSVRPADAPANLIRADLAAFADLLRLLQRSESAPRLVVVSSGGTVYDARCSGPYSEQMPLAPSNEYGASMLAIEDLARGGAEDPVILRVSNAYGPGQSASRGQGVIAYWLAAIARNESITLIGDEDVARDYVYIDDVIDALLMVNSTIAPPRLLNIGSGQATRLGDLLKHVADCVAPHVLTVERRPARVCDRPSSWLDVGLAAQTFGWRPRISLTEGLRRTWEHSQRSVFL